LTDWRTDCPIAVDQIRSWLEARIVEIERDDIVRARTAMEDPGWRIDFDLTGVPLNALARIDEHVERAADDLADRALNAASATRSLQVARQFVVLPEAS